MKTKYSITKTFLYTMIILTVISVGLVGLFWVTYEYERFKNEEKSLKEEYFASQNSTSH